MNRGKGLRRPHFKDNLPKDPAITRWGDWLPVNRGFYQAFLNWLKDSSYSNSALNLYGCAARQAIGFLNQPYWIIDPDADLERVWQHLQARPIKSSTLECYHKGLLKFGDYLRLRCHKPLREKQIHWSFYLGPLPGWLADDVRAFIAHNGRRWTDERRFEAASSLLSHLTLSLRWFSTHLPLGCIADLTPDVWFTYLDARLASGINPKTVNRELAYLQLLLRYLEDQGRPICARMLLVKPLDEAKSLPRDLPVERLRILLQEIQADMVSWHGGIRRTALMDHAWFLLMLHCGLRTQEVRTLRFEHLEWDARRLRIEQSKGLKDRYVYLSPAAIQAIRDYLPLRGPQEALPEQVFIYRHQPLSKSYCYERLQHYGRRCGVKATTHQLRHSCATLLLNAGVPVLSVQNILGHKWVDTTLGYARLYDGTVAAYYYNAMGVIERRLALPEDALAPAPGAGQLLAMVDSLHEGTLNQAQAETIRQLRAGILALAEGQNNIHDVKVLTPED